MKLRRPRSFRSCPGHRVRRDLPRQSRSVHRQRRLAQHRARFRRRRAGRSVVDPERLRHQSTPPCWSPRPGWPNAIAATSASSAGHRHLHRGIRRLCHPPRRRRLDAGRLPPRAGGRCSADDADIARPAARLLSLRSAGQGAVRTWTAIGGPAAALGPVVGGVLLDGELALDLHCQRSDRPRRPRGGLAPAAPRCGTRRAARPTPGVPPR